MTGIVKIGAGAGLLVIPPVANWLVSNHAWRNSYIIIGLAALVLLLPAAQALRRDPGQMGLLPDGDEVQEKGPLFEMTGLSLQKAIHTRQFWMLSTIFFLFVYCVQVILVHIYPHAVDLGTSKIAAANIVAIIGGVSIAGRLVIGSASDKLGSKPAMIITFIMLTATFLWLQIASEVWMLYLFAAVYGFGQGGMYTLISPMIAELFGLSSHGVIFGAIILSSSIGGAIGPVIAGHIFDITNSYQMGFLVLVAASIIATILATLITKPENTE